jgi:hypothetical protein
MSLKSMLAHRCTLIEPVESSEYGSSVYTWQVVAENVRCFLDLNYVRTGKDALWIEAAGRPADRTGVVFFDGKTRIKSGYRMEMTKGPHGTFSIEGAIDEAWKPTRRHHLEIGVIEVATSMSRPEYAMRYQDGG